MQNIHRLHVSEQCTLGKPFLLIIQSDPNKPSILSAIQISPRYIYLFLKANTLYSLIILVYVFLSFPFNDFFVLLEFFFFAICIVHITYWKIMGQLKSLYVYTFISRSGHFGVAFQGGHFSVTYIWAWRTFWREVHFHVKFLTIKI